MSCAGLAPVLGLAERAGLQRLVGQHVTIAKAGGVNPALKVTSLVAGMIAGADSIADMDLLRHGGMTRLFTGVRAPSTLGTLLRTFTFGHVAYIDVDDTVRGTYGYHKQGAGFGGRSSRSRTVDLVGGPHLRDLPGGWWAWDAATTLRQSKGFDQP